jgi:ABC-type dipeptide/oligopeptide/nickel transport system ATPase subunit
MRSNGAMAWHFPWICVRDLQRIEKCEQINISKEHNSIVNDEPFCVHDIKVCNKILKYVRLCITHSCGFITIFHCFANMMCSKFKIMDRKYDSCICQTGLRIVFLV